MKKLLLIALTLYTGTYATAQDDIIINEEEVIEEVAPVEEAEPDCYQIWKNVFDERGSRGVIDGTNQDIIISIRDNTESVAPICYVGSANVQKGNITSLYIKHMDNSLELYSPDYMDKGNSTWSINKGISSPRLTKDNKIINVIFYTKLKPKPTPYMTAPLPEM